MLKNLLSLLLIVAFVLTGLVVIAPPDVSAQEGESDCFKYYPFGKLTFNLDTNKKEYRPGETVQVLGSVVNNSDTQINDAAILIQLHQSLVKGGRVSPHILLEQKEVLSGFAISPRDRTSVAFQYELPSWLPEGRYSVSSYITSSGQFSLAGLSFISNTPGNLQHIVVKSKIKSKLPFFDISKAQVGGKDYSVSMPSIHIGKSPTSMTLPLLNSVGSAQTFTLSKKLYHWDDTNEKNFITQESESFKISAKSQKTVKYTTPKLEAGTYMMVFEASLADGTKTIGRIRFSLPGNRLRLIWSGLSRVPTEKGETLKFISCFANETRTLDQPDQNRLEFSLQDKSGKTITSIDNNITDFSPKVRYLDNDFKYDQAPQDLVLVASLFDKDGNLLAEAKTSYLNPEGEKPWFLERNYYLTALLVILVLLAGFLYRKKTLKRTHLLMLSLIIPIMGLALIWLLVDPPVAISHTPPPSEGGVSVTHRTREACFKFRDRRESCSGLFTLNIANFVTLGLEETTEVWQPGQSYQLEELTTGEYIMTGGSFDSPPFYHTWDKAYTDRINLKELIELPGYTFYPNPDKQPGVEDDEFEFFYNDVTNQITSDPVGITCDTLGMCTVSPVAPPGDYEISLKRAFRSGFSQITRDDGTTLIEIQRETKKFDLGAKTKVTVSSAPNLTASLDSPGVLVIDDEVTFQGVISNIGSQSTGSTSLARFRLDENDDGSWDSTRGTPTVPDLPATGVFFPASSPAWTAVAGTHRIELCADINNDVIEPDETDNCTSLSFTVLSSGVRPWVKTEEGTVGARGDIKMKNGTLPAGQFNADYLVIYGNTRNNFKTAKDWLVSPHSYDGNSLEASGNIYDDLFGGYQSRGTYSVDLSRSDRAIRKIESQARAGRQILTYDKDATLKDARKFSSKNPAVVFVEGNLTISRDVKVDPKTALVFVVSGDINVESKVKRMDGFYIANGDFNSKVDGGKHRQLTVNGSVMSFDGFGAGELGRDLTLNAKGADDLDPSEIFKYTPRYLWMLRDVLGESVNAFSELSP